MTIYAYDLSARHLLAVVEGGTGALAHVVARLHPRTDEALAHRLAHQLSLLSSEAWLAYTDADRMDPAPAAIVCEVLRAPHLVVDGRRAVGPDWVVTRAREVGRTLAAIGSAGVRRAVVEDVAAELDGVSRALLGDLAGRAAQAVRLSRLDASPVQISAADELLATCPEGPERLLVEVEPTAACVAAAHWLTAAVSVVRRAYGGGDVRDVLDPRAAAEPFDVVAPCLVVEAMTSGVTPLGAVQRLLAPAMQVARGFLPDPHGCDVPGLVILDPVRPARHLLDRLLAALRSAADAYLDLRGADSREMYRAEVRSAAAAAAPRLLAAATARSATA